MPWLSLTLHQQWWPRSPGIESLPPDSSHAIASAAAMLARGFARYTAVAIESRSDQCGVCPCAFLGHTIRSAETRISAPKNIRIAQPIPAKILRTAFMNRSARCSSLAARALEACPGARRETLRALGSVPALGGFARSVRPSSRSYARSGSDLLWHYVR